MKRRIDQSDQKFTSGERLQQTVKRPKDIGVQARSQWWVWTWTKVGLLSLCVLSVTILFLQQLFTVSDDLSRPSDFGLNHTINIYLNSEEGVRVGVWYTVPEHRWKEAQGKDLEWYEKALGDGSPIFIYLHGNTGNRSSPPHRIGVANVLSAVGYHVLVLDYRGFGDSTSEPTELGLTTDTIYLYNWVKARSGNSLVCVWGHSLGSGVATNTAVKLQEKGKHFDGIILEGAFRNGQVAIEHPFTWFYWKFPYIQYYLFNPLKDNILNLPNDDNLKKIRTPLMLLHAEDDHIVPFYMAQELYNIAKNAQNSDERVKLVPFNGSLGYLHNGLYKDPHLPSIIREFVQSLSLTA
ncbi:lysophosphatidylserine lipase ABHD12-like isoform X4 [Myxocyprinus asiaticus]|uniref:lysophosphatidylserine lipase ABHD12-like isoform X3 n=1 Tax=Myxocyprinus asiaticus TaxID=70543 RepID=UPI00222346F3|nr:lysophosphatidylserine lipase ABHD12-like isoform X3 [Myxocyprinus asiaticus]XP_051507967.1 lysophosphatidylserine lipase ABHD12-like isoform X4 [Myxocyprinus asiaticus]